MLDILVSKPYGMPRRLLLLTLLVLLFGCDQKARVPRPDAAPAPVEIVTVVRSPLQANRIVTGSLEAVTRVRLFSEEAGKIIELPYQPGDTVEKDALLVRIDDSLIRAELNKADANLKQAEVDAQRLRTLSKKKLASEDELARAQTAVTLAKAEVKLLETRLAHTRIKAPFAGIISERFYEPGDVVAVNSHILSLVDPTKIKVVVMVSELLLANIKPDDTLRIRIDALGEEYYTATVARIYPTIDPNTRKGYLEARLRDLPAGARPGQLCRVTIDTETTPRRNLPFTAIRHDSQGEFVYRLTPDDKVESVRVQTGILFGNQIEILEGLKVGDRVVVKGFIGLREGKKVIPVNTKPATASTSE
ncbi:MAG: efflux RND transporter periplasmic adaptor subunit [Proteobacteria bacterium]|nr:efflux RND transporter periplasmic adaptor subunit [Pseudomonadota bacterium]